MIRSVLLALILAGPVQAAGSAEPEKEAAPEIDRSAPYRLLPPELVNAFPPEILARMREALVALEAARDGG